ncbi:hypothetical protein LTR36_003357 [Oleoguttula mirabilis]|uniref:Uncharacterized protein n=1 Tax=Oleoguttula mirabilis TaxID=1507867 RepID=A0AAV9JZ92_9PEZI|nr:hypothetical protein LTR36_003357 [Oleoguttula mirabilis]
MASQQQQRDHHERHLARAFVNMHVCALPDPTMDEVEQRDVRWLATLHIHRHVHVPHARVFGDPPRLYDIADMLAGTFVRDSGYELWLGRVDREDQDVQGAVLTYFFRLLCLEIEALAELRRARCWRRLGQRLTQSSSAPARLQTAAEGGRLLAACAAAEDAVDPVAELSVGVWCDDDEDEATLCGESIGSRYRASVGGTLEGSDCALMGKETM